MIRLPEPYAEKDDDFVSEILDCCINGYSRSPEKRTRLEACRDIVIDASSVYRRSMPVNIAAAMTAGRRSNCEVVVDAYDQKLSCKKAAARKYYDNILIGGKKAGCCPICEIGLPSELDHYLPKSSFPALALTPANLVPVCSECNKIARKGDYFPKAGDEALYHPYFEDPPAYVWLFADIRFGPELHVLYSVEASDILTRRRLARMMEVYGLNERYGLHALGQLCSMHDCLKKWLDVGGVENLKLNLADFRESAEASNLNSWTAALWRAAVRQVNDLVQWLGAN